MIGVHAFCGIVWIKSHFDCCDYLRKMDPAATHILYTYLLERSLKKPCRMDPTIHTIQAPAATHITYLQIDHR
jgi:hypothetical protein